MGIKTVKYRSEVVWYINTLHKPGKESHIKNINLFPYVCFSKNFDDSSREAYKTKNIFSVSKNCNINLNA